MTRSETLSDYGEKRLIQEIIAPICGGFEGGIGVGDDAALLDVPNGKSLLVSTDKIPEDLIALQLGLMDPFDHGRYLAQVNISDIGAMGGTPLGLVATLALPNDHKVKDLSAFVEGMVSGCAEHGIQVLGGDLGWGTVPCLSATAFGCVARENVLTRNGAVPGDTLFVTGNVGGFGTALAYFCSAKPRGYLLPSEDEEYLLQKLVRPTARVSAGISLGASGICTSCMDITDGVGQTIKELAFASDATFEIRYEQLPVHRSTSKVAEFLDVDVTTLVFGIGLDLELLGTVRLNSGNVPQSLEREINLIGSVTEDGENRLRFSDESSVPLPEMGWQHFVTDALTQINTVYG